MSDAWEADLTGVEIDIRFSPNRKVECELTYKDEEDGDGGVTFTVAQKKQQIAALYHEPVHNNHWKIMFSDGTTKVLDDNKPLISYHDDLTRADHIQAY